MGDARARAAAVPAPAAAAEPIDYFAARRAAARAVGSTFGAELSEGWLEDFCMDLDSSTEATETDLDVTLRVVGPGEGRRNYENSCSLYDGSTEALFDTNLLSDAEGRFIVAGNVIRVCKSETQRGDRRTT